ncbi:ABC transporter substrate-binding protein [bacterium]|nr:MAG: ABC transporter substrate-binding protein [bacterium]
MGKKIAALLTATLFLCGAALALQTPTASMKSTIDSVISILNDKSKSKTDRREKVITAVRAKFDFPAMSQFVLAANWKKASEEQKKLFIDKFGKVLEQTYAGRLEEYSGETVKYIGEEVIDGKAKLDTAILSQGKEIPITYKLRAVSDDWLIYDVVIEGVSLARNYNATYGEIIHKEGMDSLLKKMDEKLSQKAEQAKK